MPFDFDTLDTGNTAWLLASAALVLLMTPGLAFFYGGMVRAKNVLGMLMQNFFCMGIVAVLWVLISYSIAFGDTNSVWGGFHFAGLGHLNEQVPGYTDAAAQTIPPIVFIAFQLMFAVITPALITGATADRWKFGPFVLFIGLWAVLVYAPLAHWVFSPEGWLFKRGAEDFAGGTVVHINAGIASLVVAAILGKRRGWPRDNFRPHNVPFVLLGAGLLWFGWFGFNAGSALGANNLAGIAFVNTNTATAAALIGWLIVEKIRDGHPTTLGAASGAVAGLVAITPACGFVSPMGAMLLGVLAGAICCLCTTIKFKLGLDDSLDVGAVHLVGGIFGALAIGFLGDSSATGIGVDGVFKGGGWELMRTQLIAVSSAMVYSAVVTFIIAFLINLVWKMKLSEDQELEGMDTVLHNESAYEYGGLISGGSLSSASTINVSHEEVTA